MTWEIALGIFALVAFVISIVSPIVMITKLITKLTIGFETLELKLTESVEDNSKNHKRIWKYNEEQCSMINNHEQRLHDLDGKWYDDKVS